MTATVCLNCCVWKVSKRGYLDHGTEKRAHYRHCFFGFAAGRMAALSEAQLAEFMQDSGLIRNRRKLAALVQNARAYLALQAQGEDFSTLLWSFVGGQPQVNHFASAEQVPASTPASVAMSKALKSAALPLLAPLSVMPLCKRPVW